MQEGGLKESDVSKVTFKDDNVVELDLHFGCAVYIFDKEGPLSDFKLNNLLSLLESMTIDINDPSWKTSRSFFMSTKATINAEFGQDAKTSQGIEVIKMMGSLLGGTKYIDTFES